MDAQLTFPYCFRTYLKTPASDVHSAGRFFGFFWQQTTPRILIHNRIPLESLISVACTLVSDRNFSSQTELLAYLTVSGHDLLLNGLPNAGRITHN